ncbi:MAG: cell wall-binding repeat-containing protein [Bacteroidales bacterium]|jgi:putative cell wall-binding protein/uncharacterized protein YjdB|nr:cell wall-binding repeat-containing protein [Bacteroidales bacterium]
MKRFITVALAIIMVITSLPFAVWAATPITLGTWQNGSITSGTSEVTYSVEIPASGKMTLETQTFMQDVYYDILGEDGQTIIKTINPVGGTPAVAKQSEDSFYLVAGTYYIRVRKYANVTGDYSLKVGFTKIDVTETEPNDAYEIANPLTSGSWMTSIMATNETVDYFSIKTNSAGKIVFDTRTFFGDLDYEVLDVNGYSVIKAENPMGGTELIPKVGQMIVYLEAGTYYVRARKYASYDGKYEIRVSFTSCETTEVEPNDTPAQANELPEEEWARGIMATNETIDYYSFIVKEAGQVTFETRTFFSNVYYDIMSGDGYTVLKGINTMGGAEGAPRVYTEVVSLDIGEYYIRVRKYNAYDGKYELKISTPPVTAKSISVSPSEWEMYVGEEKKITVVFDPENTEDKTLTWESSNELAATVDQNGKITAKRGGTAIVTVTTANGRQNTVGVKVIFDPEVIRLSGPNRIETANAICKEGWQSAGTVILASGVNFADALAGGPLAYMLDAPILLTMNGNSLEQKVKEQLGKLDAENIIILGGTAAVKKAIADELSSLGYNIDRLSGANRYETAIAIAKKMDTIRGRTPESVFICDGANFPDALAATPAASLLGLPIIFTPRTDKKFNLASDAYLKQHSINKAAILGGTGAVNADVEGYLTANRIKIERIAGSNRFETSYRIYAKYKGLFTGKGAAFATGVNFPDALAGGVFAANQGIPVFLLNNSKTIVINTIAQSVLDMAARKVYVFGGGAALDDICVENHIYRVV